MKPSLERLQQDWRFVMWLLAAVCLLEVLAYVHLTRFFPLFLREELHVPDSDIPRLTGLIAASAMLTGVPLSPLWGPLADRYSRKWLLLRSFIADIVSFGLMAIAGNAWLLVASRLATGISHGSFSLTMAIQSLVTPPAKVGMAMGVVQATFPLAASFGPPLGTILIKTVGLRGLFVFDLLLVTLATVLVLLLMKEPPGRDTSTPFGRQLRQVLTLSAEVPTIRWSFILQFFMASAVWGLEPFVPIVIQRANATSPWGWDDPTALGITLGVNGLVTTALTPLLGRAIDRVGAVRFITVSSLIAMVCVFSLAAVQSLPAVWLLLLVLGIPQTASMTAFFAYLGTQTSRSQRSGVLGLTALPRNVAFLIAPSLAGLATGLGFGAVFVVGGGSLALATVTAARLRRLPPSAALSASAAAAVVK